MTDLTATDTVVVERQPRERSVPCGICRSDTWNVTAVCTSCEDVHAAPGSTTLPRYLVTLDVVGGRAELEVPSLQGPDAAGRRAKWTAVAIGWGDVDEVVVVNVLEVTA